MWQFLCDLRCWLLMYTLGPVCLPGMPPEAGGPLSLPSSFSSSSFSSFSSSSFSSSSLGSYCCCTPPPPVGRSPLAGGQLKPRPPPECCCCCSRMICQLQDSWICFCQSKEDFYPKWNHISLNFVWDRIRFEVQCLIVMERWFTAGNCKLHPGARFWC